MKRDDETVEEYFTRANILAAQISAAGRNIEPAEVCEHISNGLGEEYSSVLLFLRNNPPADVNELQMHIAKHEHDMEEWEIRREAKAQNHNVNSIRSSGVAGSSKGPQRVQGGGVQKKKGSFKRKSADWKKKIRCWKCRKLGHIAKECWGKKKKGGNNGESEVNVLTKSVKNMSLGAKKLKGKQAKQAEPMETE